MKGLARWMAAAAFAAGLGACAQTALSPPAQIQFSYENEGLEPSQYTIVVDESGAGHYKSELPASSAEGGATEAPRAAGDLKVQPQDRDIVVSRTTRDFLFSLARARRFFSTPCDYGKGKIAFQGKKVLSYKGTDGNGSCTYNWSNDAQMDKLTRVFEGISLTLETGQRLTMEHHHDRLALDKEIASLVSDTREGRAAELENIAEELQSIAGDEQVLQRARARATMLLQASAESAN